MALKPGQLKCIQTLDKPIVVAAGAGSGKTFTLTKRIVGALESGFLDDIGQVCAITFTNKAAAELKSRVKAQLRASGLLEQSLKADDAWISTIHGMCSRILRAHAVELDIDPLFQIADSAQVDRFMGESLDEVLALAQLPGGIPGVSDEALEALFAEYPASSQSSGASSVEGMLRMLVEKAAAHSRGLAAFTLPQVQVNVPALAQSVLAIFEEACEAAQLQKAGKSRDAWLDETQEALEELRAALAEGGVRDPVGALRLMAPLKVRKNFGSADFKALMAECAVDFETCLTELRLAAARPHLDVLVELAGQVLARFTAKKRLEGLLDNDDLLVLASDALENHPAIAAEYTDRFKLVMVDEFQDTDQMQVDMIKRISGPGACRLCTVGDAQQSIYRFRGADVSVYRRHLNGVRSSDPDGVILLPDNFRSHRDVLSLVDRVFERDDMFGGEFMSLAPGRDEAQVRHPFAGDARIMVQQVSKAYKNGAPTPLLVREQARRVALAFAQLRDAGHTPGEMAVLLERMTNAGVYAQALREQGLACVVTGGSVFKDTPEAQMVRELACVAVNPRDTEALWNVLAGPMFQVPDGDLLALATVADHDDGLPRRRRLDVGLRALQAWLFRRKQRQDGEPGGPHGRFGGRGRAETQSPQAADDADIQDEAFTAAFAGGGWQPSPQLECAARVLGRLIRATARTTMSRQLMRAVVDSGWISRLQGQGPEGLASAANVYKAIRMIEDIEAAKTVGPAGALKAFEDTLASAKEPPGALSTTGGEFVRIMTVHASKGLEFPIVAVAEFRGARAASSSLVALEVGDGIVLSLDLYNTLGRIGGSVGALKPHKTLFPQVLDGALDEDALKQLAAQAEGPTMQRAAMCRHFELGEAEESKRLLYVALTRARECLVVSLKGERTNDRPNGMPTDCTSALVNALQKDGDGFAPGRTLCDFGGTAPAVVEHIALELQDDGTVTGGLDEVQATGAAQVQEAPTFMVPAEVDEPHALRVPYAQPREDIFSYTAVAEASHEGDLLARLAGLYAVHCDAADQATPWLEGPRDGGWFLNRQTWVDHLAAQGEDDDGSWAYMGSSCADGDKATDFGTAFHRLAQLAVLARPEGGRLEMPTLDRVRALVRACRLEPAQGARLDQALARWFGSDEARGMEAWDSLEPEVPFFIPLVLDAAAGEGVAGQAAPARTVFLEGEIDLLAMSADGTRARVVDYKTGGNPAEAGQALREKHVLQASCYAYSLLLQGVQEVEASFVRVERGRADDAGQPQCVRYRFTAADVPDLRQAIAHAYLLARG